MPQRDPEDALKAMTAAENLVVEQGGVIHEDLRWDAAEVALDGEPPATLVEIINGTRKYEPKGGWGIAVGRN